MLTLEDIFNRFKTQIDAGNKLNEIISTNENEGQVRTEDSNFIIQLTWKHKGNIENKVISFKQKKDLDWNRIPLNEIKNGDKEKIETEFNLIKNKLINKNININNDEVNNNGVQRNKEINKESKEINNEVINVIEQHINDEPEIIQKEIDNKISKLEAQTTTIKKRGRPKAINKD